jgi:hypothetical protein
MTKLELFASYCLLCIVLLLPVLMGVALIITFIYSAPLYLTGLIATGFLLSIALVKVAVKFEWEK